MSLSGKRREQELNNTNYDDCFKIKSTFDNINIQNRSEEDVEYLRIPSFPLAVRKEEAFIQYVNMLMYDVGAKSLLMKPIPFEVGMLQFEMVRKKGGFNILHP